MRLHRQKRQVKNKSDIEKRGERKRNEQKTERVARKQDKTHDARVKIKLYSLPALYNQQEGCVYNPKNAFCTQTYAERRSSEISVSIYRIAGAERSNNDIKYRIPINKIRNMLKNTVLRRSASVCVNYSHLFVCVCVSSVCVCVCVHVHVQVCVCIVCGCVCNVIILVIVIVVVIVVVVFVVVVFVVVALLLLLLPA